MSDSEMDHRGQLPRRTKSVIRIYPFSPKTRFRATVRRVIENGPWMVSHEHLHTFTEFYKRRIMKSRLTLMDKIALNKPFGLRTEEERQIVHKAIGNIGVLRKYPQNVKRLIADHCRFRFHPAGKTLVRQGRPAENVYFVISGEAELVVKGFNDYSKTVTYVKSVLRAGESLGEIVMLYDLPLTGTVTLKTPMEFIILEKKYFDIILKGTVKSEWDFISAAMKSFSYFRDWDQVAIGECCKVAAVLNYHRDQVILSDGRGRTGYTHFILKGKCALIEQLYVLETGRKKKSYQLYRAPVCNVEYKPAPSQQCIKTESEGATKKILTTTNFPRLLEKIKSTTGKDMSISAIKSTSLGKANFVDRISSPGAEFDYNPLERTHSPPKKTVLLPPNCKVYFVQVCTFGPKASFGLGESFKGRHIIATESTQCLLIPRNLLRDNGPIWNRIKQYLKKWIPDTEAIFQEFVTQRELRQYKADIIKDLLEKRGVRCHINSISNVPYSIRIRNDYDKVL